MNEFTQKYRGWDLIKAKPVWIGAFTLNANGSIKDVEIIDYVDGKAHSEWRIDGDDLIIIRSTGLFDASKKEIWEGDIVKQSLGTEFGSMIEMVGEMVWHESGSWNIKFESDSPLNMAGNCGKPVIIGNRFMHPDLLKGGDKPAPKS